MNQMTFWIPLEPRPAVRMTTASKYKNKYAKEYLKFKDDCKLFLKNQMASKNYLSILTAAVDVEMHFWIEGSPLDRVARGWDVENCQKAVMDAMNEIVFTDDWQVVSYMAAVYGWTPVDRLGIDISVNRVDVHEMCANLRAVPA